MIDENSKNQSSVKADAEQKERHNEYNEGGASSCRDLIASEYTHQLDPPLPLPSPSPSPSPLPSYTAHVSMRYEEFIIQEPLKGVGDILDLLDEQEAPKQEAEQEADEVVMNVEVDIHHKTKQTGRGICKFENHKNGCKHGENCMFRHPGYTTKAGYCPPRNATSKSDVNGRSRRRGARQHTAAVEPPPVPIPYRSAFSFRTRHSQYTDTDVDADTGKDTNTGAGTGTGTGTGTSKDRPLHTSFITIEDLSPSDISSYMHATAAMRKLVLEFDGDDRLKYKQLGLLFAEPSTRTHQSFTAAMQRLGGSVIDLNMNSSSSIPHGAHGSHGEISSLPDTLLMMGAYCDGIVVRHPGKGSALSASFISSVPIINGGDGDGEHPTQALADLYTMLTELHLLDAIFPEHEPGPVSAQVQVPLEALVLALSPTSACEEVKEDQELPQPQPQQKLQQQQVVLSPIVITIVGDIKYSCTVHSLLHLLSRLNEHLRARALGSSASLPLFVMQLVCPKELQMEEQKHYPFVFSLIFDNVSDAIPSTDVLYVTRLPIERHTSGQGHDALLDKHLRAWVQANVITPELIFKPSLSSGTGTADKNEMIIMHPFPRSTELSPMVDIDSRAKYFQQAVNCMYVRMAVLDKILGGNDNDNSDIFIKTEVS